MVTTLNAEGRRRRNRWYMSIALVIILATVASLSLALKNIAAKRKAEHAHTFFGYVTTHHLGTLTELDDGTGLDPISYDLTLAKAWPDTEIPGLAQDLMKRYVTYDHGYTLTIFMPSGTPGKPLEVAQGYYDDHQEQLTMTLFPESSHMQKLVQHEDW